MPATATTIVTATIRRAVSSSERGAVVRSVASSDVVGARTAAVRSFGEVALGAVRAAPGANTIAMAPAISAARMSREIAET
jgi:hypothetical protein